MSQSVIELLPDPSGRYTIVSQDLDLPYPVPCLRCPHARVRYEREEARRRGYTGAGYYGTWVYCRQERFGGFGHAGFSLKALMAFGSRWGARSRAIVRACATGRKLPMPIQLPAPKLRP